MGLGVESAGLLVFEGGKGIKEGEGGSGFGGECSQVKERERERLVVRDFRGKTEQWIA